MIVLPSFMERAGNHTFREPSSVWGYLPQVNEWARGGLEWYTERVGGQDHIPIFRAVPICESSHMLLSMAK